MTDNAPEVWAIVDHGDGLEVIGPFDETALDEWVSDMGGEWLGPLSPDDKAQGRVEGLREAVQIGNEQSPHHLECALKWARKCEQRANEIEQAAQDEKGVGDGNG